MKRRGFLSLLATLCGLLGACAQGGYSESDNQILHDRSGCAFYSQHHLGNNFTVKRVPSEDLAGCRLEAK